MMKTELLPWTPRKAFIDKNTSVLFFFNLTLYHSTVEEQGVFWIPYIFVFCGKVSVSKIFDKKVMLRVVPLKHVDIYIPSICHAMFLWNSFTERPLSWCSSVCRSFKDWRLFNMFPTLKLRKTFNMWTNTNEGISKWRTCPWHEICSLKKTSFFFQMIIYRSICRIEFY